VGGILHLIEVCTLGFVSSLVIANFCLVSLGKQCITFNVCEWVAVDVECGSGGGGVGGG